MTTSRLEQLGLRVEKGTAGDQAVLELGEGSALENPLTHQPIPSVTFQVSGDQLVPVAPPAVVGLPSIWLEGVESAEALTQRISDDFDESLFHLERRSAQLQALGLSPSVDPETLALTAELKAGAMSFTLAANREGHFQVEQVRKAEEVLTVGAGHRFELSEFRELSGLSSYLLALVDEALSRSQAAIPASKGLVSYGELAEAFGSQALVPPRSSLEVLVQLSVNGEPYRFAAARLAGRTFRGLLAGAKGKVWSERFDLDDFPGVVRLVADLLKVPAEAVKAVGVDAPQE
ncbi:hypothetical protein [Hyalangium rubrum]|uniref:Uncharacterized protein n=1 Tax=Hyalangium rubrum TaxID=3103134 RepID=A0ABU5HCG9_9BACT|nr:hypothetical protein [Hyalangium sp. s54d21]MDY7231155.1 hypothetical protein [Hyalangium sp. s54d21]